MLGLDTEVLMPVQLILLKLTLYSSLFSLRDYWGDIRADYFDAISVDESNDQICFGLWGIRYKMVDILHFNCLSNNLL
jgi:hypothetical protein